MLNIHAPFNSLGFGVHATNWVKALDKRGFKLGIKPIGQMQIDEQFNEFIFKNKMVTFDNPTVALWHPHDIAKYRGTPLIGYTVFETSELTPFEILELAALDAIWVPSQWALDILNKYSELDHVKKFIVPEGVDPDKYHAVNYSTLVQRIEGAEPELNEVIDSIAQQDEQRFVMISVGKFEERKGCEQLLEAISKNIRTTPICLIALWDDPFDRYFYDVNSTKIFGNHMFFPNPAASPAPTIRVYDHVDAGHRLIFMPRALTDEQLVQMYSYADLGVFPYKGEGWNLPLIECLACETRVIATDYSGPTEYLHKLVNPEDEDAQAECGVRLLRGHAMATANDGRWFRGDRGEWAEPSSERLISLLIDEISLGRGGDNTVREALVEQFSWDKAAERTEEVLKEMGLEVEYKEKEDE